jgi:hypothetical protein
MTDYPIEVFNAYVIIATIVGTLFIVATLFWVVAFALAFYRDV